MTWQDELQNLDAELAAGRISAEEYRQRRDAVLGRAQGGQNGPASGGFPQQQPGTPSGGLPQQPGTPAGGTPQQQGSPFPPAFSWGDAAAQGAQQQAQPQQQVSGDATQVVPNPVAPQPPQNDSESTQVVNLNQQQQQWPAQQPPPQQPQWGPQQGWGPVESTGTPWGDDLPGGQPEHGDAAWMRQGPEVFDSAGKSGKGKLIAGLSIGGVLVVGLIVALIFFFTSGNDSPGEVIEAEPTVQTPPPPTTKELPEPPAANPNPPANPQDVLVGVEGPAHPWNGPLDLPALQGHKAGVLQPQAVLDTAIQNGLTDGWFTKTDGPPQVTLLALRMPSPDAASTVVQKYLDAQQGLAVEEDLSYKGVEVVSTGSTFRTAYVSHGWVVIIDSSGEQAEQKFKDVLSQQLAKTPPTVRD
ncbi:hypothetical protein SAMN02982929_04421 [Saccharopolyspora kobensis]|uniref:Uncharacterized protein n=1 Tax=Saccharopolyspora kobensis TaxID=146035 RepID=A0A1H6DGL2_9PSEU|nr:hypothetical protein [Saccharopolyspora kobensis]SEG84379.1 hypothetical protein SAMN02982929_04421 [Saccharopolyspora kobensis]SFD28389.1 hypothetical protein SAMN05216506_103370 [Saccharopolyspora kobensis]